MRILRLPELTPRVRRAAVPITVLAAATLAAGTGSAAAGHRVAESARYVNTVTTTGGSVLHAGNPEPGAHAAATTTLTPFTLFSPDFVDGGRLPSWTEFGGPYAGEAGCAGKNLSPSLGWFNAPAGTKSYALFVHDVDAPQSWGWTHWITYNIPGSVDFLPKGDDTAYTSGTTDWQANGIPQVGWGGPCPPADGETHHYVFTLYALSAPSISTSGLDYAGLMNAMAPYVLGAASVVGTYSLP
jgi:Raf kinase inhibitor-like YbhB/YbcL family protein